MIPKQLTLQNFLSYREVTLNFDGLHIACVCGPNGAGKSSLLEAIAWCVWGQSRVNTEDDIVRQGAREAQVSFCFEHNDQTYRIIRTRRRSQNSALEFQIQQSGSDTAEPNRFKSITQKGVRATQQYILQQIKIDYETFVNAAYLRQGRADEFMLKRPSERKQVLADLLKLDSYDRLAEQAKEKARGYKAQVQPLELIAAQLTAQIERKEQIQTDYEQLQATVEQQRFEFEQQQARLATLRQQQQEKNRCEQQLALEEQQLQHQQTMLQASQASLHKAQQSLNHCDSILKQTTEIEAQRQQLLSLKQAEEKQAVQFQAYQEAQAQRLHYQQVLAQQRQQIQGQIDRDESRLADLQSRAQSLTQTLDRKPEVNQKRAAFKAAKKKLHRLDKMQAKSAPLQQRLRELRSKIEQAHTRLVTRIEELDNRHAQMETQRTQAPQLVQAAVEISHRIEYLEQRQAYQEAVRQKGIERRSFVERLQANQVNYEIQLAQLAQTLEQLEDPDAACCPLCEQALDGQSWQDLRDRTRQEKDEVQNQIWAVREQLAVCESEIQTLRKEYRELEDELAKYAPILEERGQLKAKLASADVLQDRLQEMGSERAQLERCLQENDYAENLQDELQQVEAQIAEIEYDDRDHALVRSQIERLRWSELKYAEIKQAEHRLNKIRVQMPQVASRLQESHSALDGLRDSKAYLALAEIEERLSELDYSLAQHNQLRAQIRQFGQWEERYQELQRSRAQEATLKEQLAQMGESCQQQEAAQKQIAENVARLRQALGESSDLQEEIAQIEDEVSACQQQRDRQLSQLGRLQQQLSQLENLQVQREQHQQKLSDIGHKHQVYKSLSQAFGRNGIQALMIENLLPQLEAETNQLLGKLSDHQLHVQFLTQRSGKNNRKIDTLDILIADARGTRPYETYSGGEAFRVNFAIRLAIARLLALRSGMSLKMLIVDEGFGTQDREGCDRLIAAIEAIASDFACILTITHMPHFREAFQTRIDVSKDEEGSHILISG